MRNLYILWTNADITTSRLMVFMYAENSLIHKWWDSVTIIVWGASSKLIKENVQILVDIKELMEKGVQFIACRSCADLIGSTRTLEEVGITTDYIGQYLTEVITDPEKHLITV